METCLLVCDGKYHIGNLVIFLAVKEFWKYVKIWWSYHQRLYRPCCLSWEQCDEFQLL